MPCTTILVGKKASYDGSTIMARNEDSGANGYCAKKLIVVQPEDQPRHYKSVISKVEIDLPDDPMRYTAMPNAIPDEGIWGEAGINKENISMSETETITSNPRVLGADPLVPGGIGEEDFLTIVLPYIHSAREGVKRLGSLLEQFGTYEMNGIGFQDVDEIWWLETIGGHHWMAKRVPDDCYVVMPNQLGIDRFDLNDAFGEQTDHMCSADLKEFIRDYHLDLAMESGDPEEEGILDPRAAFGSKDDSDHCYNTPRAWFMAKYLNPRTCVWEGPQADFGPEADDIPWAWVPEKKVTVEDVKYVLSSYYQGTEYDPYSRKGDSSNRGKYRPIGINRNNFLAIAQIRPYLPEEIRAIEWIAEGSNAFNALVPFYTNVEDSPAYLRDTTAQVTTENFYWANRLLGALADAQFNRCIQPIERYQITLQAEAHRALNECEREYLANPASDVPAYLAERNGKMATYVKEATYKVLDKVLWAASNGMKNSFSRSDN